MKMVFLAVGLVAIAEQSAALSCNFGNTASAWVEAEGMGDAFVVAQGTFDLPEAWRLFEEEDYTLPAQFSGHVLNSDGTTRQIRGDVTVIGACINGDCGYLSPAQEVVTFLHGSPDAWVTYSMPCSSYPLAPTAEVVNALMSCMNDGPCEPEFQY